MDIQNELSSIMAGDRVHSRLIDRIAYANDASYFRLVPQAVVQPVSIDEIKSLFKFSQHHRIPLTFRAAGTSLSGQAVTDGILVDISKHWAQYSVEDDGNRIKFQPGIIGGFLNNVLKPYHRRLGPDPASIDFSHDGWNSCKQFQRYVLRSHRERLSHGGFDDNCPAKWIYSRYIRVGCC